MPFSAPAPVEKGIDFAAWRLIFLLWFEPRVAQPGGDSLQRLKGAAHALLAGGRPANGLRLTAAFNR